MFVCVGERMINLTQVSDVAWEKTRHGDRVLKVYLTAPEAASVGASDWTSEARALRFEGAEAAALWEHLLATSCRPPKPIA